MRQKLMMITLLFFVPSLALAIDTPCALGYHREYSGYYDSNNTYHQTFTCIRDTTEYSCGNECTNLGMIRGTVEFDMCLEICINPSNIIS